MGKDMLRTPITILEHMTALGRLAKEPFDGDGFSLDWEPADLSAIGKDGFRINIGNPLAPNQHGVMAVNTWGFGLTPWLNLGSSALLSAAGIGFDTENIPVETETSLRDFLDQHELDLGAFLHKNQYMLKQIWGAERYARVLSNQIPYEEVMIPPTFTNDEGQETQTRILMPGTNFIENFISDTFHPYGRLDSVGETIMELVPSTMQYMFRGLGMLLDDDDPTGSFLTGVFGPRGKFQCDAEILSQMMKLEAGAGYIREIEALALALEKVATQAEESEDGPLRIKNDETGRPVIENPEHPMAETWMGIAQRIIEVETEYISRATNNAAWSMFIRGMLGQMGPATPQMFFDEQEELARFWGARNDAEEIRNSGTLQFGQVWDEVRISSPEELMRTLETIRKWLDDPSGDEVRAWIQKTYPAINVFLQGKSYWGDNGPPPETKLIEDFFRLVDEGLVEVYPPDIFIQKHARTTLATDREIAIIEEYGNDSVAQVQGILNDPIRYRDLMEDYRLGFDGLDWVDAMLNEGAYQDWKNRNPDDTLSFYEELKSRVDASVEAADDIINAIDLLSLAPDERQRIVGIIKAAV
ncbi:MAG: hypothetical protein JSW49_01265, partial [candidate division WOR-3 bacterium]